MGHERFGMSNWFGLKVRRPEPRDRTEIDYLVEELSRTPMVQSERVIAEFHFMEGDTGGIGNPQDAPDLPLTPYSKGGFPLQKTRRRWENPHRIGKG